MADEIDRRSFLIGTAAVATAAALPAVPVVAAAPEVIAPVAAPVIAAAEPVVLLRGGIGALGSYMWRSNYPDNEFIDGKTGDRIKCLAIDGDGKNSLFFKVERLADGSLSFPPGSAIEGIDRDGRRFVQCDGVRNYYDYLEIDEEFDT